ncbi:MAG: MFS transporter [Pseudomonadota bacterium]
MALIRRIPPMSQSAWLRYTILFMVLLAQGFPLGLFFFAMPIWLAANDVSPAGIGLFVSAATLPWTFKLVSGFLVDRFTYPPMGKRRAWLVGSQALIVLALLVSARLGPDHTQILMLAAIALAVNTFCAFQDTAINGLAVDLVPEDERARANGFILAGEAVGTAIGTILCGVLIARVSVEAAYLAMAVFVALSLVLLLITRERPGERLFPWTQGQASQEVTNEVAEGWSDLLLAVWQVMSKRDSLLLATALGVYGFTFGLYAVIGPVIATQFGGWSEESFATLNGLASLIAGVLGVMVFGWLVDRLGARPGSALGMFLYAMVGVAFVVSAPYWQAQIVFIFVVFLAFLSDVLMRIGAYATAMRLCDLKGAATQFALFLACANIGTILSGFVVGGLDALGGQTAILLTASSAGISATIVLMLIKSAALQTDDATDLRGAVASETA